MLLGTTVQMLRIERPEGDPFEGLLGYKVWHRGKKNAVLNLKDESDLEIFISFGRRRYCY